MAADVIGGREGYREMAVLRHVVGETLRAVRLRQRRTLREVSAAARVSLGYLSEIERGHKEPSSELLAAICEALDIPLSEVFLLVSDTLRRQETMNERAMVLGARRGSPVLTPAPPRGTDGPKVRALPNVAA
jgi:transcriptional regulator with XRE-family HTH domain